jgi:hypothetical protein
MHLHDLIQRLGLELRQPDLALPPTGVCAFRLDAVTVTVNHQRAQGAFTLRSLVAQLTDTDFTERAQGLLAANLVTGPTYFSVDANGAVYATQYFRLATLSFDRFMQRMGRFVDVVERWQAMLASTTQHQAGQA